MVSAAPVWLHCPTVRPARRIVKTELDLPREPGARAAVIAALIVGGSVALGMVILFSVFLYETFRTRL